MRETEMIIAALFTAAKMAGERENNLRVYFDFYDQCLAAIEKRREGRVVPIKPMPT